MENVVLTVHLILALCLIGIVLLQRSEGGGLGMGGGGGGGVMSSRAAATALGKLTWIFAIAFIATSLTLTIIAAEKSDETSVLDRLGTGTASDTAPGTEPAPAPAEEMLLPPSADDTPVVPPRAD